MMPRIPVMGGVPPLDGSGGVPTARAPERRDRDAAYALGQLPEIARLEADAMARARARAGADGAGFAEGVLGFLGASIGRLSERAPSRDAGAMTDVLSAGPLERAGARAVAMEAQLREDHRRALIDGAAEATRARIAADPDGAEDSFNDLLGGLTLAADGWLGAQAGEDLARRLEREMFDDAARRLVERDPADAAQRLGAGLWGDHLDTAARDRLAGEARARARARDEDAARAEREAARDGDLMARRERTRAAVDLFAAAEDGAARREDIAAALGQGRLAPGEGEEILAALGRAEDAAAARDLSVARVTEFLQAPRPEVRPEAGEIETWWAQVLAPSLDGLAPERRVPMEDRVLRRLGHVPPMVAKPLRAALYGREPDGVVAAALRLKGLLDALPEGGLALRGNERAAVEALSAAVEAMPDADTALDHAARRLGAATGENWRAAIMTHEWRMDDGGGARPLPPGRGDSSPPGIRHAIVHGDESFEGPEYKLQSAESGDGRGADQLSQGNDGENRDIEGVPGKMLDAAEREDMEKGADILFDQYRTNLGPREGGKANRPNDRGGPTNKGVSQVTLDELRKKSEWSHLPKKSFDLTDRQINDIYRSEYFDQPKVPQLANVPGLKDGAPQIPEQFFDSVVLHGQPDAGIFLQQAIKDVTGIDLRVPDKDDPNESAFDGDVGPDTRAAVAQAIKEGKIEEVNNRMVDYRVEHMKNHPDFKHFKEGWLKRAESFRINKAN